MWEVPPELVPAFEAIKGQSVVDGPIVPWPDRIYLESEVCYLRGVSPVEHGIATQREWDCLCQIFDTAQRNGNLGSLILPSDRQVLCATSPDPMSSDSQDSLPAHDD